MAAAPESPVPPETATIVEMTAGDRACYLALDVGTENKQEALADFSLCERTDLIGRRVRFISEPASIQAAACEGDPECTETEEVMLVMDVEVLPR